MQLRHFLQPTAVKPALTATSKDGVLEELVALLGLPERRAASVVQILKRREQLGSTGVGRGIAIPHGRSLAVKRLRLAFGVHPTGIEYQSIDGHPVYVFFLIVAPPLEVANQYLPVLGRLAQLGREPGVADRLRQVRSADELYALFDEKGV
ncbi:MAG: PTS sugar transporter subunit IIA [Gemmatimonadales bacterium]